MKETRFIAQNKEKWEESENLLTSPEKDPEKLSNLFTQVVDDLSYSRTYYQNRSVRVYLNKIAREYFSIIYSHKKEKKNRFKLFWLDELPQIVIYCRKPLLISLVIFLAAAAIGVFSSMKDPQFPATILGEGYVAMTKENIEKGDPMAVYKSGHQVDMFLGITYNNLQVAFRTYVFGLFMSIGTIAILLSNGIMVGCFQFFFIERGLFAESALTIWLHGTLEISSIILAGGAGITLGSGLIFPGTYSRLQAFQISAIRSLKLMLGITPIFIFAAIIESFLTRYTEVPDIIRLFLIVVSAVFILGYFVFYPWYKSKKGFQFPLEQVKLQPISREDTRYDRVKTNADILNDAFQFYQKNISSLLPWILSVTILVTTAHFLLEEEDQYSFYMVWWQSWITNLFYSLRTPDVIFIFINAAAVSLLVHRVFAAIHHHSSKTKTKFFSGRSLQSLAQTFIIMTLVFATFYYLEGWGSLLMALCYIVFMLWAHTQQVESTNIVQAFSKTMTLIRANFGQFEAMQIILLLMSFSFLLVLDAPLLFWYADILRWNFTETDVWIRGVFRFIETFVKVFGFLFILPLISAGIAFLYYNLSEITTATHLKQAIALVGTKLSKHSKR